MSMVVAAPLVWSRARKAESHLRLANTTNGLVFRTPISDSQLKTALDIRGRIKADHLKSHLFRFMRDLRNNQIENLP